MPTIIFISQSFPFKIALIVVCRKSNFLYFSVFPWFVESMGVNCNILFIAILCLRYLKKDRKHIMLELLKVLQNAQISHGNCTNSRSNCGILEIGEPVWRIGEGISNRFPSPHSQLRSFADSPDPVSHNHIRHYKVWNIFLDRPLSVSQSPITIIHLGQLFPTNQYFYFTFSSPAKRWLLDKMGLSEQVWRGWWPKLSTSFRLLVYFSLNLSG